MNTNYWYKQKLCLFDSGDLNDRWRGTGHRNVV